MTSLLAICALVATEPKAALVDTPPQASAGAFSVWERPLAQPLDEAMVGALPSLLSGDFDERAMVQVRRGRPALQESLKLLGTGLKRKSCEVGQNGDVFGVFNKARAALLLGAVNLCEYPNRTVNILATVLGVGQRLQGCDGSLLSYSVGLSVFAEAQALALLAQQHGHLKPAATRRLQILMRKLQPDHDTVAHALEREASTIARDLRALEGVNPRLLDDDATLKALQDEFALLAVWSRTRPLGWVERWDRRRGQILNPEDRQFVEVVQGLHDLSDMKSVNDAMAQRGNPPPNIIGRVFLSLVMNSAKPVESAGDKVIKIREQTKRFALGRVQPAEEVAAPMWLTCTPECNLPCPDGMVCDVGAFPCPFDANKTCKEMTCLPKR